jgi:ABC-type polar amino acid transport system ATPase subunit
LFGTTLSTFLLSALFVWVTALIQIVFKLDSVYSALLINITIVSLIITIKDMDFFRNIADSQWFLDKGNEKIKMRKKRTKQLADLDEENEIQESDAK